MKKNIQINQRKRPQKDRTTTEIKTMLKKKDNANIRKENDKKNISNNTPYRYII